MPKRSIQLIGVISDTHGLLRPQVMEVFKGVSLILHGGDIGRPEVLDGLRTLAPVIAVRGNNDKGAWAKQIPHSQIVHAGMISIYMIHDAKEINFRTPIDKPSSLNCLLDSLYAYPDERRSCRPPDSNDQAFGWYRRAALHP